MIFFYFKYYQSWLGFFFRSQIILCNLHSWENGVFLHVSNLEMTVCFKGGARKAL